MPGDLRIHVDVDSAGHYEFRMRFGRRKATTSIIPDLAASFFEDLRLLRWKSIGVHDPGDILLSDADCSGSGWKYVMNYSNLYQREERRATRCDCNTCPHRPRKVTDTEDTAYITARVAELDAAFRMRSPRRVNEPKSTSPAIPMVAFTAEQIQQRKPAERGEIYRVEDQLAKQA
jgi:hypothetical protein